MEENCPNCEIDLAISQVEGKLVWKCHKCHYTLEERENENKKL